MNAQPTARIISVSGKAVIKTAPDEFVVTVGVDTFDMSLALAKEDNDTRMRDLLAITKEYGLEAKDVRTDDFRIEPRYEGRYVNRTFVGYDVHKRLAVVLRDADKLEAVLEDLFAHGANRLDGVTYQSSKAIEKREEARVMAVKAARHKAEAMAKELGQELGRPLKIQENVAGGFRGMSNVNNFVSDNYSQAGVTETMATGKIEISTRVSVEFELVEP
ncbi:MAG: SIMPL domain-containing protein [Nannocystaceae bacterium]